MLSAVWLTDENLLLRPFRLDDAPQLNCAVRESLKDHANPKYILTERGVGYRFVDYKRQKAESK